MLDRDNALDLLFWGLVGLTLLLGLRAAFRNRRSRGWRAGLPLALASSLLACVCLELGTRFSGLGTARGVALVGHALDSDLGWSGTEVRADEHTDRPRVLVLGDSFTLAPLDGGAPYYERLRLRLKVEPWAFSAAGWGTLQQLLVLEREFDRVRPGLVVLQVCSNDFINNSLELEAGSTQNNFSERPYWRDGQVVRRYPGAWLPPLRFLAARSALVCALMPRLRALRSAALERGWLAGTDLGMNLRGTAFPPFARAVRTTEELLTHVRRRCRNVPLVAVPSDDIPPCATAWREILARQGVPLMAGGLRQLREAQRRGEGTLMRDGYHWNTIGHRYVGDALAGWMRLRGLVAPEPRLLVATFSGRRGPYALLARGSDVDVRPLAGGPPVARWQLPPGEEAQALAGRTDAPMLVTVELATRQVVGYPLGPDLQRGPGRPLGVRGALGAALGAWADFDADGQPDALWHDREERRLSLVFSPSSPHARQRELPQPSPDAILLAALDLDGDSHPDLVWRDADGRPSYWYLDGRGERTRTGRGPARPGSRLAAAALAPGGAPRLYWDSVAGQPAGLRATGVLTEGDAAP